MHRIFVYGTLTFSWVRWVLFHKHVPLTSARLSGWRRVGTPFFGMTLEESDVEIVDGFLVTLTDTQKRACDVFEQRYVTREVITQAGERALVYVRK